MSNELPSFMSGIWACGCCGWVCRHSLCVYTGTVLPAVPVDQTLCHSCCPRAPPHWGGWVTHCCLQGQAILYRTQLAHLAVRRPCTTLPGHLLPQCCFSAKGYKFTSQHVCAWRDFYAWVAAVHSLSWLECVLSHSPHLGRGSPDGQAFGEQSTVALRFRGYMEIENPNKSNLNNKP